MYVKPTYISIARQRPCGHCPQDAPRRHKRGSALAGPAQCSPCLAL